MVIQAKPVKVYATPKSEAKSSLAQKSDALYVFSSDSGLFKGAS